ncbi:MAG: hypothetical protein WAJ94_02120 [Candidatus Cybelea sp.]
MTAQPLEIRMGRLESVLDSRFAQAESRFAQVDERLQRLGQKVDGLQWQMTSLIVVTWVTTILAVLLHHA